MSPAGGGALSERYAHELAARGFQADEAQQRALLELDALRERLIASHPDRGLGLLRRRLDGARWPPERGLYLWGEVGRGKTWLMDLFYQSLPFPERRRTHFHRFMQEVHAALAELRRRSSPLEVVAAQIARRARVLCLDELAVIDIGDAMILAGLFAALLERGVTLVITSNMRPAGLYQDGLQRQRFLPAIELLEAHTQVVELAGTLDYRLRELTRAGTYLRGGTPETEARLGQLFATLGGQAGASGGTLEILGRRIPVVRRSAGAVWFEFAVLCGGTRSQEDYIEISREYPCVILANVPVLDASSDDAARRFIALIDVLYDHHVDLVVSAAAAPHELYRGERLGSEFRRTASRLMEMQSEQYLAREHRA